MADEKASAVSLVELLRAVPWDAVWCTITPNGLGFMDTHSIPVGQLCYAAAEALSKPATNTKPSSEPVQDAASIEGLMYDWLSSPQCKISPQRQLQEIQLIQQVWDAAIRAYAQRLKPSAR